MIDGVALADLTRDNGHAAPDPTDVHSSARNGMVGLVTSIVTDRLMARVAVIKSPDVVVETSASPRR